MEPSIRTTSAARPLTSRSAVTNDPMRRRANGNTAAGRRIRDLYRAYLAFLPTANDCTRAAVLAAAELVVAAENARADLLAGSGDVEQVVRLENLAARSVRRLGIKHNAEPPSLTLEQHLADLEREAEAKENAA